VYVTVTDTETKKSRSFTVYETTVDRYVREAKRLVSSDVVAKGRGESQDKNLAAAG